MSVVVSGGKSKGKYRDAVADFFGVAANNDDSRDIKQQNLWQQRRLRLLNRRCGGVKDLKQLRQPRLQRLQDISTEIGGGSNRNVRSCDCEAMMVGATNLFPMANTNYNDLSTTDANGDSTAPAEIVDDVDADLNKENVIRFIHEFLERREAKRPFGFGLVGRLLERKFKKNLNHDQGNLIYSFTDYRPYFTYWVTTVQIVVLLAAIVLYGYAPYGTSSTLIRGNIQVTSLAWQWPAYYERENIWFGPRASDLVHLGAKFTPCMRKDRLIYDVIDRDREDERTTGCCQRSDGSGCLQTQKEGCSYLNSVWLSWNETTDKKDVPSFNGKKRTSGPVCGQDPSYCVRPASIKPHEWEDNISKWPICSEKVQTAPSLHHMSCELLGRPCCIGIHGQCRIINSDHCAFLRGTFHPEATLCSQVSCMEDVCGMIPFYARDYPDQFYRIFTALFLHAGVIHLAITVALQYYIMRDIERLTGPLRMAIIYIVSGVAGYLASASFVPYHTQVGPSGSQFALLASLIVEVINGWDLIEKPMEALMKLILIASALLIIGLLPWIDNYAHIFGFITGFLLSYALLPYLTFKEYNHRNKIIQIWLCLISVVILLVTLTLPLYIFPVYSCSWCKYLDCIPFFPDWCADQDIKIEPIDIL